MGGAGVPGDIERADRGVWGAPCASCKVNRRASARCSDDFGLVPGGSPGRKARGVARPYAFDEVLAFLAALVPTSFLSFLFLRTGKACASGDAPLARRQTDCVRPMADR